MNTSTYTSTQTSSAVPLYPLQRLVMPSLEFGGSDDMYVRQLNPGVISVLSEKKVFFSPGGKCSFDTFYNGFTVQSWQENCDIPDLLFSIEGKGTFIVRIGLHRLECDKVSLFEKRVHLTAGAAATLNIEAWPSLVNGMIYVEVEAVTEGCVIGGGFSTTKAPEREVRLGIVVTHFKREQYVISAAHRIREGILVNPDYKDQIALVIVDNSQTLDQDVVEGAILIPNQNLGGSGGFTRGLLHLKDEGTFTHCLFMDDDASCELESILRTHALLGYAIKEKIAVAGALLRDLAHHFLFEKGAQFDGMCQPLKHGLDMRNIHHLMLSEYVDKKPDFGGWWFFAFSLSDVKHYAFPFFVRGDDIMFSMMNKFDIITQNGIACYGDDFGYKSGPLQIYLDVRNHLVQKMTHLNADVEDCIKLLRKFFDSAIYSYNYATARAVSKAAFDVMKGHEFWLENMDTSVIRKEFSTLAQEEKMRKVRLTDIAPSFAKTEPNWCESKKRRLLRSLTFNGTLLPDFLRKDTWLLLPKNFSGDIRATFRYNNILYYYGPTQEGYCARRDGARLGQEKKVFSKVEKIFKKNYSIAKRNYEENIGYMTSEEFWRKIYKGA
ncbi:glycosyltransferase family 2 protein [Asaia spathodeae]|uniref:Glycosyltransferase n=1 Tax=Asaia spathodeae TaxID=657016 RepID=A0ABX2P3U8_9PROT|nr:glycosyltransferase family 2 protein [Asaia spathodeae]